MLGLLHRNCRLIYLLFKLLGIGLLKIMKKQRRHLKKLRKARRCSPRILLSVCSCSVSVCFSFLCILDGEIGPGMRLNTWNLPLL